MFRAKEVASRCGRSSSSESRIEFPAYYAHGFASRGRSCVEKRKAKLILTGAGACVLFLVLLILTVVELSDEQHESSVRVSEARSSHIPIDESATHYDDETGSRPYGGAGGERNWVTFDRFGCQPAKPKGNRACVRHFFYGVLPFMSRSRMTEPNSSQALYLQQDCGYQPDNLRLNRSARLGQYMPASPSSFPWLVRIAVRHNVTDRSQRVLPKLIGICGGVIIAPKWILTARHCYERIGRSKTVILYDHFADDNPKVIEQERIYSYPGYVDMYNQNDFVLVKVKIELPITSTLGAICLPNPDVIPREGRVCLMPGWSGGYTDATKLEAMWMEIEDPDKCQSRYCGLKYDVNANLCDAQLPADQSVFSDHEKCHGLSGNPLICEEHGRWVAYGILNWSGPRCDVAKGHGFAAISTRLDWICCHVTPKRALRFCDSVECKIKGSLRAEQ